MLVNETLIELFDTDIGFKRSFFVINEDKWPVESVYVPGHTI